MAVYTDEGFLEGLTDNEYKMATKNIPKLVITSSIPPIIGMLVNAMYNVADRFWVGQMGSEAGSVGITSIGLTMPITTVLLGLCQLIGLGAAATISISLGQRDKKSAEKIIGNTLSFAFIFYLIFMFLTLVFLEPILIALGAHGDTFTMAEDYIRIIIYGSIFQLISFTMNHPIRATGNSLRFAMTQVVGAVSNIILDPIFIFPLGLGLKGAAYATILAQFISACFSLSYYFTKKSELKIRIPYLKPDKEIAKKIISIGVSPFLMQVASSIIVILLNNTLIKYGILEYSNRNIGVNTMTIINGVFVLFFMPILGLNQGVQPIIGFNYGSKNHKRVKSAYKWSVIYAYVFCLLGFVLIQAFAPFFIGIFDKNPDIIKLGSFGIRIFFFCFLFIGFQVLSTNLFQSIGKAKISIFLSLLRQIIIIAPLYFILPKFFGLKGIFFATPVADLISSVFTAGFVYKEFKENLKF